MGNEIMNNEIMNNENQFIPDYSPNLSDTELFTPIVAAVGIFCFCVWVWGYYTTPPAKPEVIHQGIIWVQTVEGEKQFSTSVDIGTSIDLNTYAEALHFPDFDTLLSHNLYVHPRATNVFGPEYHNLYVHPRATNVFGPEYERTFCELTALKPITSYVEHLRSQFIVSDLAPDLVNA